MPAKATPKAKPATVSNVAEQSPANKTAPTKRKLAVTTPSLPAASKKMAKAMNTVAVNGSTATGVSKAQSSKRVKYGVSMPPAEHDAIVALKHRLSDLAGVKTKKGDIVRAGVLLLLSLPDVKIRAALGKISALNGTSMTAGDTK